MSEAAAIRASVERGDPFSVFSGVIHRGHTRSTYAAIPPARTDEPKANTSDAVTADTEPLDAETDGNYPHSVAHRIDSDGRQSVAEGAHGASQHSAPPPFDRAAWLARVQRIDPRERKP